MKIKKVELIVFLSIIIILSSIAIITKKSFNYDSVLSKNNWDNYYIHMSKSDDIYYDEINDVQDILENSSLILKVKMSNNREILNQCILSEVKVEEVYKNNLDIKIEKDNDIYIYEPISVQEDSIYLSDGYIPMNTEDEYILCLKPLKIPEKYVMSDKEKISFMYYNPIYGKKNINNNLYYINEDNTGLKLSDLKEYNVILESKDVEKYNNYNEIMMKYK